MTTGFTRQETIALTGTNSGRISYLDKTGLVVPEKFGNSKHPVVIYSWEKILQIKTIERLRERLSLQEIRKVLDFLKSKDYKSSLFTHSLFFVNDELYFLEDFKDFGITVSKASGKNKGQVVVHEIGPIGDIISELRQEAKENHVYDFEKRAQAEFLDTDRSAPALVK